MFFQTGFSGHLRADFETGDPTRDAGMAIVELITLG